MSENESMGKFLGEVKIEGIVRADEKTPLGASIMTVLTEDGKKHLIPESMLGRVTSEGPVDASAFRDMRAKVVCEKIMDVLSECDMEISDWDYISSIIKGSIGFSYEKAEEIMWGTKRKTVLDLDRVLKKSGISIDDILKDEGVDKSPLPGDGK